MSEKLLPCPFCGGPAGFEEITPAKYPHTTWSVGCANGDEDCIGYQMLASFSRKCEAAEAWNKRAVPSRSPAETDGGTIERSAVRDILIAWSDDEREVAEAILAAIDELPGSRSQPATAEQGAVASVLERVARHNSADPATDDLSVQLAIELAKSERNHAAAKHALALYRNAAAQDCFTGADINQQDGPTSGS